MRYRDLILEEIYGKFAKVYHRTQSHENVQAIKTDGFQSGPRALYGAGIYATYSIFSQFAPYMVEQYGEFIIKSRVNLEGFLILDEQVARNVYGKQYRLVDQAKKFKSSGDSYRLEKLQDAIEEGEPSSHSAREIVRNALITGMRGLVYTGRADGKCVVCYETDTILPISWTQVTMEDVNNIRSQKMVGVAEREFANSLQWTKIINSALVANAMRPNALRDMVTNPSRIKDIANPSPEVQLVAVTADPNTIRFIKHPTPEAQVAATSKIPSTIEHIADPVPEAILFPLMVSLDVKPLVARLKPGTILAALQMSCMILPAIVRGSGQQRPDAELWAAAWRSPDAEQMIKMYLPKDRRFDVSTIPPDALETMLTRHPAYLQFFPKASAQIVAAAVLSPHNSFGNMALSSCALEHIQVDCSEIPESKLAALVAEQPFLIYAIHDVPIPLVAIAMKKDRRLANELARNHDLPPELKALVPGELRLL